VIKFTDDDCDNITVNVDGVVQVGGKVKFVPFGKVTTQGVGHEWLTQLRPPAPLAAPDAGSPAVFEVADSALIDSSVSSTTDDSGTVHYSVTASRRSLAPMASSGNEGIADALDQAFDNGEGSAALTGLAMMAAPEKIDICLGSFQPISATTYATLSGSQSFSAGVGSHLQSIRQGMTMASSPVKANLPSLAGTGDTAVGEVLQAARAAASETTEWQVSGRYLGDFGRLNSDGVAAGNRWKTNGFMVNLDRQINTNLVIGAAAGGSWSYIDINHDSGDAETTSLNARLYAAWFDGPWHVDALAGYGRNWNESRRHMAFLGETAKADWNSDVYTARLGGGYDLELGDGWIVEPNAAAEYTRIQNDSYNEHGSSTNLSVDGNNFDSLRHLLGVALRKGFTLDNKMVIRPEARLTWAHEYMDTTVRTSASLFGGSFTTNGVKQARDSAIIGLGLNLQFNETVGGYVSYDTELSNDKTAQGVSVGIRFNF
jgi:outer membrane autotransporter protein